MLGDSWPGKLTETGSDAGGSLEILEIWLNSLSPESRLDLEIRNKHKVYLNFEITMSFSYLDVQRE